MELVEHSKCDIDSLYYVAPDNFRVISEWLNSSCLEDGTLPETILKTGSSRLNSVRILPARNTRTRNALPILVRFPNVSLGTVLADQATQDI